MGIKSPKPARTPGRPSTSSRISVGAHGEAALELLYRLGGATAPQLAAVLDISEAAAARTLKGLERSRLCEQNAVKAWWHPSNGRPRSFYYLASRDSGRGVVYGAYLAGEEDERKARASYKLCQLPARAAHASLRNDYYLLLREDAAMYTEDDEEQDVEVPAEELWSESHYEFPFLDEGMVKNVRANARRKFGRIYPDGYLTVEYKGLTCRYLLEVETQSRARKLIQKIDGYGSYLRRRLKEDPERMREWLAPVVFLFRQNSTRDTAFNTVKGAIKAGAPELKRFNQWGNLARKKGIYAGRLILFASLEELREYDSFEMSYRVLTPYPEDSKGVSKDRLQISLRAAAREVSETVARMKEGR